MINPIELLHQKLYEIEQAQSLCEQSENRKDLNEIQRQKQMYQSSIDAINNTLKLN